MRTLITIFFFLPLALLAQTPAEQVNSYMQQLRQGESPKHLRTMLEQTENHNTYIKAAQSYTADTMLQVQAEAYYLIGTIGFNNKDSKIRQNVTEQLVEGLGKGPSVALRIAPIFEQFQVDDFSAATKKKVGQLLKDGHPGDQRLLRLAGFLQLKDQESTLLEIGQDKENPERLRWTAYLALSRMGNAEATHLIVEKIRRQPLGDDLVYEILPDLAWVRQSVATDYLAELLLRDSKECSSPDPDSSKPITCAYRIMEMLAPTIKNFPLKVGESGDIETESYTQALEVAREWFRKNGNSYQLVKDRW